MLRVEAGVGDQAQIEKAAELSQGFGRFVRSLVGLDRAAVVDAFSQFISAGASARQIEFIELVIEHLTEQGAMDPGLLYESPFTDDLAPHGPEQVFDLERTRKIVGTIAALNESAIA